MFAGAAFLLLLIPANGVATAILGNYETQIMQFKDQRMKLLNEMLSGIKVGGLYTFPVMIPETTVMRIRMI